MDNNLCEYMTSQAEEIRKVLGNFEKEEIAILDNDRTQMRRVLAERHTLLEGIQTLRDSIGKAMEAQEVSTLDTPTNSQLFRLNWEIGGLMSEIDQKNERNKILLQLRVVSG